jgi:hypothetical protein
MHTDTRLFRCFTDTVIGCSSSRDCTRQIACVRSTRDCQMSVPGTLSGSQTVPAERFLHVRIGPVNLPGAQLPSGAVLVRVPYGPIKLDAQTIL